MYLDLLGPDCMGLNLLAFVDWFVVHYASHDITIIWNGSAWNEILEFRLSHVKLDH